MLFCPSVINEFSNSKKLLYWSTILSVLCFMNTPWTLMNAKRFHVKPNLSDV